MLNIKFHHNIWQNIAFYYNSNLFLKIDRKIIYHKQEFGVIKKLITVFNSTQTKDKYVSIIFKRTMLSFNVKIWCFLSNFVNNNLSLKCISWTDSWLIIIRQISEKNVGQFYSPENPRISLFNQKHYYFNGINITVITDNNLFHTKKSLDNVPKFRPNKLTKYW